MCCCPKNDSQTANLSVLLDRPLSNALPMGPVMFKCISGDIIRKVALHSKESAGLSRVNTVAWRQMYSAY